MRCYICDAALSSPVYNSDTQGYEPCERCLAVIHDAVGSFMSKPSAQEDDLGGPDPSWDAEPDTLPLEE